MYARIHDVTNACRYEDSGAAIAVDNAATLSEEIHAASTEAAAVVAAATIAATEREPIHMPPKEEPLPPASVFASSNLIQVSLFPSFVRLSPYARCLTLLLFLPLHLQSSALHFQPRCATLSSEHHCL